MNRRVIKKSLVNIQPLHSASRLSELGMDPIRATIDKIREMELMLYTMRQMGKRSLVAETAIYANLTKAIQSLIPYGYMTVSEAEKHMSVLKNQGGLEDAADSGIQIFLTNESGETSVNIAGTGIAGTGIVGAGSGSGNSSVANSVDSGNSSVDSGNSSVANSVDSGNSSVDASSAHVDSLVGSSDSLDCSLASGCTQPPTLNTTFQPDESIDERLRSMVYTDRIDIENGLAEVLDDNGEILDLAINESDNMMQSILSVKRSSGAPGNSGVF